MRQQIERRMATNWQVFCRLNLYLCCSLGFVLVVGGSGFVSGDGSFGSSSKGSGYKATATAASMKVVSKEVWCHNICNIAFKMASVHCYRQAPFVDTKCPATNTCTNFQFIASRLAGKLISFSSFSRVAVCRFSLSCSSTTIKYTGSVPSLHIAMAT